MTDSNQTWNVYSIITDADENRRYNGFLHNHSFSGALSKVVEHRKWDKLEPVELEHGKTIVFTELDGRQFVYIICSNSC